MEEGEASINAQNTSKEDIRRPWFEPPHIHDLIAIWLFSCGS